MEPKTSPSPLTSTHINQCTQRLPFLLALPDGHRKSAASKSFQSVSNSHDFLEGRPVLYPKHFKLKRIHFPVSSLEYAF